MMSPPRPRHDPAQNEQVPEPVKELIPGDGVAQEDADGLVDALGPLVAGVHAALDVLQPFGKGHGFGKRKPAARASLFAACWEK